MAKHETHRALRPLEAGQLLENVPPIESKPVNYRDIYPVVKNLFATRSAEQMHNVGRWLFSDTNGNGTYVMPGETDEVKGIKIIQSHPDNIQKGMPRSVSTLTLFDKTTGLSLGHYDSTELTPVKTAAESAVALKVWEKQQDTDTIKLGIVGGGPNARAHFEAFSQLSSKKIDSTTLYSPRTSAQQLAEQLSDYYPKETIKHTTSLDEVIESSNVLLLATTAKEPIFLPHHMANSEPKLVIALGFHDISEGTLQRSTQVIVDDPEEYRTQKDLPVGKYLRSDPTNVISLSDTVRNTDLVDGTGTTVFAPYGLGTVDIAVAHHIHKTYEK